MHTHRKIDRAINCAVLTVSDTRDKKSDKGGQLVQTLLHDVDAELAIKDYAIVKDEKIAIQNQLQLWLKSDIDVIITTGGTGIAPRDVTIEAVEPLLTKKLDGFGELFRYLSYAEDVGTRALLSRAIAGTVNNKLIFTLPGSTGAVNLAMKKLIQPELNHMVYEINKKV